MEDVLVYNGGGGAKGGGVGFQWRKWKNCDQNGTDATSVLTTPPQLSSGI